MVRPAQLSPDINDRGLSRRGKRGGILTAGNRCSKAMSGLTDRSIRFKFNRTTFTRTSMSRKKSNWAYWISTALLSLICLGSAFFYLTHFAKVQALCGTLGYIPLTSSHSSLSSNH
jgi:hypothetical protein